MVRLPPPPPYPKEVGREAQWVTRWGSPRPHPTTSTEFDRRDREWKEERREKSHRREKSNRHNGPPTTA